MESFIQAAPGVRRHYFFLLFIALFVFANCETYSADIEIIEQPKELLDCEGAKNLKLRVLAKVAESVTVQYQWYKDGNPISGATKYVYKIPVMNATHNGVYRCRIWTSSESLYTRDVAVYTLGKTSILSQDTVVMVPFGKGAALNVFTHTKGHTAPFFQQGYQWYRKVEGQRFDEKLEDGEKYSGTKSPRLYIKSVEGDVYSNQNEGYYLEVSGQCGKVYSDFIHVMPNVGVKFTFESALWFWDQPFYDGCPVFAVDTSGKRYWDYTANCKIFGVFDSVRIEHICVSEAAGAFWLPYNRVFSYAEIKKQNGIFRLYDSTMNISIRPESKHSQKNYTRVTFYPGGEVQESFGNTWVFYDEPVITKQPKTQTVNEGATFTLSVDAKCVYPLTYQWYHNGDTLYTERKKTLSIRGASYMDEGAYWVEIGHRCDTIRSDKAIIRTKSQPTIIITKQPQSIKACEGATDVTLSVEAVCEFGSLTRYTWYKDGVWIKGEKDSILKIPVLTADKVGKYQCRVWDPYTFLEGERSNVVEVSMYPKTKIIKQDSMMIFKYGKSGTLSVETQHEGPADTTYQVKYQWYRKQAGYEDVKVLDGELYSGTNTTKLTINSVDNTQYLVDKDGYYLEIEDNCGKTYSDLIHVSPALAVIFSGEFPESRDGCPSWEQHNDQADKRDWEYTASYKTVAYKNFDSVRFEHFTTLPDMWYYNYGTDNVETFSKDKFLHSDKKSLFNKKSKTFSFTPTHEHSQSHKLRITFFPGGEVFESPGVTWTFHDVQEITKQPQSRTVVEGSDFTLSVDAKCDFPLTYQWRHDGDLLHNKTGETLTILNPGSHDEGAYWVEVGSECDTIYSDTAIITVKPKGVIGTNDAITAGGVFLINPNPVTNVLEISFNNKKPQTASFKILELSGREVMNFTAEPGEKFIRRDISLLASGTYFILMEAGGERYVEKFNVVK